MIEISIMFDKIGVSLLFSISFVCSFSVCLVERLRGCVNNNIAKIIIIDRLNSIIIIIAQ